MLILDPFLRAIDELIDQKGLATTRACADDIGAAIANISALRVFSCIFRVAADVANLRLKPRKCNVVPTAVNYSPHAVELYRNWLAANTPAWYGFHVDPEGKYLGFMLGPAANDSSWTNPLHKWIKQAKTIGAAQLPGSVGTHLYNSRAVPVLGYVAQLIFPSSAMIEQEIHLVNVVLHLPGRSVGLGAATAFNKIGMMKFKSAVCSALASIARAALGGKLQWQDHWHSLLTNAELEVSAAAAIRGRPWASHWKANTFAANLFQAAAGRSPTSLPETVRRAFAAGVSDVSEHLKTNTIPVQSSYARDDLCPRVMIAVAWRPVLHFYQAFWRFV